MIGIPKEIRKLIHISEGDELMVDVSDDRIILKIKPRSYTKRLRGSVHFIKRYGRVLTPKHM
ncbi:MAG: AbrB/MazE/SpoVT family DNA-binding domain-containing protein [Nitrospinae bacterium]|nr:AbrB/MazE/SpoVT family DNA-binding domain-containing protein [Nitrospinota bacterium]